MARNAAESAIAEEQKFLDAAVARRDQVAAELSAELAEPADDDVARARLRRIRRQHEELVRARDGLVFGRLDGLDGTTRHIGRLGLRDDRWQLVEGQQLAEDGTPMGCVQVWAALDALRRGLA